MPILQDVLQFARWNFEYNADVVLRELKEENVFRKIVRELCSRYIMLFVLFIGS